MTVLNRLVALSRRRGTRLVLALLVLLAIAFLVRRLLRQGRRRGVSFEDPCEGKKDVSAAICFKRKDEKGNPKWYNPKAKNGKGACTCFTCKNGTVTDGTKCDKAGTEGSNCPVGRRWNGAACVPEFVESPQIATGTGTYETFDCPGGTYINNILVRYNNSDNELKNMVIKCSDGKTEFKKGFLVDRANGGGYEARDWTDPHGRGWNKVGYVTSINSEGKKDNRVRAFGPDYDKMFGSVWGEKGYFDCAEAGGKAPKGKRWNITGLGIASGRAIDRMKVRCRLMDGE